MTIGKAIPHESAVEHVTGRALYTDDLVGRFGRVLHAWPVQAFEAHAKVTAIDTRAAAAMPGVVTILGAADVPGDGNTGAATLDEPMFPEEVEFWGQPVA
ncbi:MAG: xanthine dehydrogenase molybdopterin binding subunit, partial [Myxococcales bacterium]|nr:xanthine dehydrogenase molybdopterin binding subunit [Myxococcales bacterium]